MRGKSIYVQVSPHTQVEVTPEMQAWAQEHQRCQQRGRRVRYFYVALTVLGWLAAGGLLLLFLDFLCRAWWLY